MAATLDGPTLNDGQCELVRSLVADPRQVALALAPAGAGKTTAMSALTTVCRNLGYDVVGLAPSAAAAAVLGEVTGMPTETLAMLDHTLATGTVPNLGPRTAVVIDEAGMADTPTLDRVIAACTAAGARVRLIGDDQQLAAVGAGGVLATSPPPMAPYVSTRSSASTTRSRRPPPWRSVTATGRRSGTTSTTTESTSARATRPWPRSSTTGRPSRQLAASA
jgi:ATP-dependent exoDNAse (exonuclease V) alpha subunit